MRAAVLTKVDGDLEIRDDVELGGLGPGDVRVALAASGICHTDVSVQNGTIRGEVPIVLGHEGAGVVREVGSAVSGVSVGDHVILSAIPACGFCSACLHHRSHLCEQSRTVSDAAHFRIDDRPVGGFAGLGTFAEELIIAEPGVVRIDSDVPLDLASLIGCGVTTGVGAAIHGAGVRPASSVVVFGCGGVGVSAIQGARIAGASAILAVDTLESRLEQARHFGATHVTTPEGFESAKAEITGSEGFDYALECIGHPETIRATWDAARRGGTAVIVGVGRPDQTIEFNAFELFHADKTLRGSMYGSANARVFMPQLLALWKAGRLDLESMVTRRLPLDEVNDAFRGMCAGEGIRAVIEYRP